MSKKKVVPGKVVTSVVDGLKAVYFNKVSGLKGFTCACTFLISRSVLRSEYCEKSCQRQRLLSGAPS